MQKMLCLPGGLSQMGLWYLTKQNIRVIKLTLLLLTATFLQVSAGGYAQQVTLDKKNASLEKAFEGVYKQIGYQFVYTYDLLHNANKISIEAKNELLKKVLETCFKNQPFTYALMRKAIIVKRKEKKTSLQGQQALVPIKVAGKVTDNLGNPLIGVTIKAKEGEIGTVTDANGNYSITVPDDAVLIVSYVGYQTREVSVNGRENIDIKLESTSSVLDQVVVLGYSEKIRSHMASSVSVVSDSLLNDITSEDLGSLLQGKVAGLVASNSSGNPNSSSNIVIRGVGSINAGSNPLYVVDGIVGGSFDPKDVESVTVLKDAATTALYGSRASNGVIVITTKSGKVGQHKLGISVSVGFSKPTTGNFHLMNTQQLYNYEKFFYPPDLLNSEIPKSNLSTNTNWFDEAFRTALSQDYHISYSGGSEMTQVYVSGDYFNNEGTLRFNDRKRYNFRTNLTQKINDKIKFDVRFNADYIKSSEDPSGSSGALYGAYLNIPWDDPYNADGSIKKAATAEHWFGRERENFLYGWQYNLNNSHSSSLNGDINLHYSIAPHLSFSSYNRISYEKYEGQLYYDQRTTPGKGIGYLTSSSGSGSTLVTSNRLRYKRNFDLHSLDILIVGEGEKDRSTSRSTYGQGLAEGLHIMDVASDIISASGYITESAFFKGLAQINYSYRERYFVVGSIIDETSSRFGSGNRSAIFYSGAAGWLLSEERFMSDSRSVDLLKFRVSYGVTGNANIGNYQSLGLYSFSTSYAGNPGSMPSQIPNKYLTWEKAKKFDIGIDLGLFDRLALNLDVYNKKTSNLLLNVELPYTTGFGSILKNVGSIQNRGLEVSLSSDNLVGKFKWNTKFNIAFNNNKVLSLAGDKNSLNYGNFRITEGQDMNTWYMREWAGVDPDNGDPLWVQVTDNGKTTTNKYSDATLLDVGTASPDFTGGMRNSFSFNGFSLSVFLNFVSGNLVYNNSRFLFDSDGAYYTFNAMVLAPGWSRWKEPGDNATHPKPVYGGNKNSNKTSSRYLEDGSYLRLRNLTFSYSLPHSFLDRIKMKDAKVLISCDNLLTFTDFSGPDPEVPLTLGGGSSSLKYPISKRVVFGLKFTF